MKPSLRRVLGTGVVVAAVLHGPVSAQQTQVTINGASPLLNLSYQYISSIGWYFTPTSSFFLTSMQTRFNPVVGTNQNRTVMAEIWTDRPAVGGTLLRSSGFQSSTAMGTFGGGSFNSLLLQAGVQYFLGFRNVEGLGMNRTGDLVANKPWPTYVSFRPVGDDTYDRLARDIAPGSPTLKLIGNDVTTVPEPMTMTLLATGLLAMVGVSAIRQMRKGKRP